MSYYNNAFMGKGGLPRTRTPLNTGEPHTYDFGHPMGGGGGPVNRMPHVPIPRNMNRYQYQDARPHYSFGTRFSPYMRMEMPYGSPTGGSPRYRFPNPAMASSTAAFNNAAPSFGDSLNAPISYKMENYSRSVNTPFTEVCASVTIRTRTCDTNSLQNTIGQFSQSDATRNHNFLPNLASFAGANFCGDADLDFPGYSTGAVGSAGNSTFSSPYTLLESSQDDDEYDPLNPGINKSPASLDNIMASYSATSSAFQMDSRVQERQMTPGDSNKCFDEAYVGVCISRYPSVLGRMMEVAGFGVWFSDENKSMNFSGVLKSDRHQNLKAIMIHGSAQAVDAMKRKGYSLISVYLESAYLKENVLGWISKYMDDPEAPPSNWDEVKYNQEILELCIAATGMLIKWSHTRGDKTPLETIAIGKAKQLAKEATDAWMKDLRQRQEAVGTGTSK